MALRSKRSRGLLVIIGLLGTFGSLGYFWVFRAFGVFGDFLVFRVFWDFGDFKGPWGILAPLGLRSFLGLRRPRVFSVFWVVKGLRGLLHLKGLRGSSKV